MYQTIQKLLKKGLAPNKIQWIRLDHPLLMPLDLGSLVKEAVRLAKATKEEPLYLFLDELVYAEKWDLWLKTFYDEHWPVMIIASSSATAGLKKGRESGVGRWEEFHLTSYLLTELLELQAKNIPYPAYKKRACLFHTIESLAQSLNHTQLNFERERKMLISLGGFPEFLAGIQQEKNKFTENTKKELQKKLKEYKIPELEKQLHDDKREAIKSKRPDIIAEYEKMIDKISKIEADMTKKHEKQSLVSWATNKESYFRKSQQILRSDAIERAIYKDIPQSYRIDNPMAMEKFLYVLAGQVTGLFSPTGISKEAQISPLTLERYLNYLIQTHLVFTLSNYDKNERNIQRRQRKAYFVDGAVRNSALLKEQESLFKDSSELGKLQENLLASHLYHLGKLTNNRLFHYRRGKYEVDLVYEDPVCPMAFEVGFSQKHSRLGLKKFLQENPKFQKGCYYVAPDLHFQHSQDSPSGIGDLPLDLLLLAIGLEQDRALSLLFGRTE